MRILVLSNLYPPNALGGYELSCRDVVDRWRARGHEVLVLTTARTVSGVVEPAADQPHVRRELGWYWADHAFLTPSFRDRLALERANHAVLRAALAELRPDVVSVWHMGGMSLSLLTALDDHAVVLNVCDDWPDYGPRADAWSAGWSKLPRSLAGLGSRVFGVPTRLPDLDRHGCSFVSAFTRDGLRHRTPWELARSTVVGSGVDGTDFPPAAPVDRMWTGVLLAVGRVEPRKGFDTAVAALALLPSTTTLRLVGVADPEHLQHLQAQASALGVGGRLDVGAVPRAELKDVYGRADALLFTSRWEEPFGLVPLEAMTQALPVIATRRGGSAEFLVDEVNCLEVPAGDGAALAAAVARLAADPALRRRLVEGGLATAATYTVDALADRLEALHVEESRLRSLG